MARRCWLAVARRLTSRNLWCSSSVNGLNSAISLKTLRLPLVSDSLLFGESPHPLFAICAARAHHTATPLLLLLLLLTLSAWLVAGSS